MDANPTSEASNASPKLNRKTLIFIVLTAFLSTMGIGLINPVAPFIVTRYISDPNQAGIVLGWLISAYAICQFVAAPGLGALSDRYGRRPILLICLLGSAVGYLLFGLGGALWILFLGRIIDGLTGANFSVIFAYIADLTPPEERSKFFGWLGALAGIGFILGPVIGGLVSRISLEAPLYMAAGVTFANVLYGLFFMPESLPKAQRVAHIPVAKLNPFSILREVFAIPQIRWLLIVTFLFSLPFAALQANMGLFAKDALAWDAIAVGTLSSSVGVTDIFVQGLLLGRLLKRFGETRVAIAGLCFEIIGYLLIASVVLSASPVAMFAGVMVFAMGDGLLGPALQGLISRAISANQQGKVQGGSQSVQAVARVVGPLIGGDAYDRFGHASPYLAGAGIVALAIGAIWAALPGLRTSPPDLKPATAE